MFWLEMICASLCEKEVMIDKNRRKTSVMREALQAYDAVCVSGFVSTLTACHPNNIMAVTTAFLHD